MGTSRIVVLMLASLLLSVAMAETLTRVQPDKSSPLARLRAVKKTLYKSMQSQLAEGKKKISEFQVGANTSVAGTAHINGTLTSAVRINTTQISPIRTNTSQPVPVRINTANPANTTHADVNTTHTEIPLAVHQTVEEPTPRVEPSSSKPAGRTAKVVREKELLIEQMQKDHESLASQHQQTMKELLAARKDLALLEARFVKLSLRCATGSNLTDDEVEATLQHLHKGKDTLPQSKKFCDSDGFCAERGQTALQSILELEVKTEVFKLAHQVLQLEKSSVPIESVHAISEARRSANEALASAIVEELVKMSAETGRLLPQKQFEKIPIEMLADESEETDSEIPVETSQSTDLPKEPQHLDDKLTATNLQTVEAKETEEHASEKVEIINKPLLVAEEKPSSVHSTVEEVESTASSGSDSAAPKMPVQNATAAVKRETPKSRPLIPVKKYTEDTKVKLLNFDPGMPAKEESLRNRVKRELESAPHVVSLKEKTGDVEAKTYHKINKQADEVHHKKMLSNPLRARGLRTRL